MDIYRVTFAGHRNIFNSHAWERKLEYIIAELISKQEYVEFYIGRNGDFDILASSVIKRIQEKLGRENSSLILVLPYNMAKYEQYISYYDEIIMPLSSAVHPKAAIIQRNRWMIKNAELLIAYVEHTEGGAYEMVKYAESIGEPIINLAEDYEYFN